MDVPQAEIPIANPGAPDYRVPWSLRDSWVGLGVLVLIQILLIGFVVVFKPPKIYGSFGVILLEGIYVIPAVIILGWRRANWKLLGFRKFAGSNISIGCGFLLAVYIMVIINNIIFSAFGKHLQSYELIKLLKSLPSPYSLAISAIMVAPPVEEIFFRGFLFAGFRQRYGWKRAALLSSIIFAVFHLQLAALIPTFLLGFLFSYLYERSNSILPGMLLHCLVNIIGISSILFLIHSGAPIPP